MSALPTRLAILGIACVVGLVVWLAWPPQGQRGTSGPTSTPKLVPPRVTPTNSLTSSTAAESLAAQPIPVLPTLPGKPEVLSPRRQDTTLIPTRQEVQTMMARARQGLEKEPEWAALIDRLSALDFRDYPEEYAGVVRDPGWLHDLDTRMTGKFRGNDEPAFVEALLTRYEAEKTTMRPITELTIAQLLGYMTSSPALIPALIKGLDTTTSDTLYSGCASSLLAFGTAEVAQALVERAKVASETVRPREEFSRRALLYSVVDGLRNPELLPYLEKELSKTQDAGLAIHLRAAITGTKQGWPPTISAGQWELIRKQ